MKGGPPTGNEGWSSTTGNEFSLLHCQPSFAVSGPPFISFSSFWTTLHFQFLHHAFISTSNPCFFTFTHLHDDEPDGRVLLDLGVAVVGAAVEGGLVGVDVDHLHHDVAVRRAPVAVRAAAAVVVGRDVQRVEVSAP